MQTEEQQKKVTAIFAMFKRAEIKISDIPDILGGTISRNTLYRWKDGKVISDKFRFDFLYNMARRIGLALKAGDLPLLEKYKKDQRVALIKDIVRNAR